MDEKMINDPTNRTVDLGVYDVDVDGAGIAAIPRLREGRYLLIAVCLETPQYSWEIDRVEEGNGY